MFWFQEENNVANTLMFVGAAQQCCPEPRPFAAKDPGIWEGRELGQLTEVAKGIFHTI